MTKWIVALLVVVSLAGCKTAEPVSRPSTYSIKVGRGGGFTGMYTFYEFNNAGKILQSEELDASGKEHKTFDKKVLDTNVDKAISNQYETVTVNDPGNFTNYMRIKYGSKVKLYKWQESSKVPEWVTDMHAEFWKLGE